MTLTEKVAALEGQLVLLKVNLDLAFKGDIDFVDVRHYHGQVRRTVRSIGDSIQKLSKKQRKERARKAIDGQSSSESHE